MAIEDQLVEKKNELQMATYENCIFKSCNFERADFSSYKFIDCIFDNCNLSLITQENIAIQDCSFKHCKILGFPFFKANTFNLSFSFDNCILDHSSFQGLKIKKTSFVNCSLKEVDFENTDCSQSVFDNCNMERALFYQTNMVNADFRTAYNYTLDPEFNMLKGAKFSLDGIPGLLHKYKIKITN